MDFKIVKENKNNVMKRKEMTLEVNHSRASTISKAAIQQSVATKEKVPATHVHVNHVKTGRGSTTSVVTVEVYAEPKSKDHSVKEAPKTA